RKVDMQPKMRTMLALALVFAPAMAFAQNDAHHGNGSAGEQSPPAATSMPQQCAPIMEMMQGMMGDHMSACLASLPQASQAYMRAMMGMHAPMMEAMQSTDPDVAFVKGMIPHHQAAIDMARAVLELGSDQQTKAWAQQIIAAQQAEIDEMHQWLRQRGE
ncbi:MAG TPA: DUF305 domain-containing protein, partial [Kaistia sp.]|nr:DUF305 domain-containing protein [Kaistia sp.]